MKKLKERIKKLDLNSNLKQKLKKIKELDMIEIDLENWKKKK